MVNGPSDVYGRAGLSRLSEAPKTSPPRALLFRTHAVPLGNPTWHNSCSVAGRVRVRAEQFLVLFLYVKPLRERQVVVSIHVTVEAENS